MTSVEGRRSEELALCLRLYACGLTGVNGVPDHVALGASKRHGRESLDLGILAHLVEDLAEHPLVVGDADLAVQEAAHCRALVEAVENLAESFNKSC